MIWFVDNTNGNDANPGTLAAPFQTLGKADTVDAASHRVFLYNGTYANGLVLNTGEWLIGQQVTGTSFDTIMGITPPAGTIARPAIATGTATVQNTITLNTNAVVAGLAVNSGANTAMTGTGGLTGVDVSQTSLTTTTGTALLLNNVAGTITLTNVNKNGTGTGVDLTHVNAAVTVSSGATITGTTSAAVDIDAGTGAFSYAGTINNSASGGRTIEVTNRNTGTLAATLVDHRPAASHPSGTSRSFVPTSKRATRPSGERLSKSIQLEEDRFGFEPEVTAKAAEPRACASTRSVSRTQVGRTPRARRSVGVTACERSCAP